MLNERDVDGVRSGVAAIAPMLSASIDRVVSLSEAGTILGCSKWTLKRQCKAGKIAILKISARRVGIRLSEIVRFLDAAKTCEKAKAA